MKQPTFEDLVNLMYAPCVMCHRVPCRCGHSKAVWLIGKKVLRSVLRLQTPQGQHVVDFDFPDQVRVRFRVLNYPVEVCDGYNISFAGHTLVCFEPGDDVRK